MRITKPKDRWFPCLDDPDNGKVLIRHLSPGEVQDIFDKTMPQKIEYEKEDDSEDLIPAISIEPDRTADRELTLKACIVDWENFFDEKGEALECTHENIVRACREIEGFSIFVAQCRKRLEKDIKSEQEDQEKN